MIGRLAGLFITMLRYRAALMIWMFFLLGAARHGDLEVIGLDHALGLIALACSYVFATVVNDIADQDIDRVNHPGDQARPLVTQQATVGDLYVLAAISGALALGSAALVGLDAAGPILVGLLVAFMYSAPPLQISYRSLSAPLLLALAYVVVPYVLGLTIAGASPNATDAQFLGALIALFLARITLKDFRDRSGDALFGRRTLLLKFGKQATCGVSLAALLIGNALLLLALRPPWLFGIAIELIFGLIAYALAELRRAESLREELVMIGLGARLGNGLLLCVLGWLLLGGIAAPLEHRLAFVVVIAAAYAANFVALRARPQEVLIGYKG